MSKIESGLLTFPSEKSGKLCAALRYPLEFFEESWSYEAAPARLYRRRRSVTQSALAARGAQMNILKHQLAILLRGIEPLERRFQRHEPKSLRGGPAAIARTTREQLRLPHGPIPNLISLFETIGIIIVPFHFGLKQIDACADWVDSQPVIFLGDHLCPSRQRFTLAHEFAHLVMHERWEETSDEEADLFAAELLLPREEIKSQLLPLNLKRLMQLKAYWRVSMAALLKQAEFVGIGSAYQRRGLWQQLSSRGYRLAEPGENLLPNEEPRILRQLIGLHKTELSYTDDQLAKLLRIFPDEVDQAFPGSGKIIPFLRSVPK